MRGAIVERGKEKQCREALCDIYTVACLCHAQAANDCSALSHDLTTGTFCNVLVMEHDACSEVFGYPPRGHRLTDGPICMICGPQSSVAITDFVAIVTSQILVSSHGIVCISPGPCAPQVPIQFCTLQIRFCNNTINTTPDDGSVTSFLRRTRVLGLF